jgi:hypothetical protein
MTEDDKKTFLWTGLIAVGLVAAVVIAYSFGMLAPGTGG